MPHVGPVRQRRKFDDARAAFPSRSKRSRRAAVPVDGSPGALVNGSPADFVDPLPADYG
jgi:hypothetical protein